MKNNICLVLLLSVLLSGCANAQERSYSSGQKALSEERYSAAVSAFEKAGSCRDAELLLQYASASVMLQNGEFANASAAFHALGDFKDSALMMTYARALEQDSIAIASISSGDDDTAAVTCMEAYRLFIELPFFRDSDQRAADCRDRLYSQATEWMSQCRFDSAANGFAALGNWGDCAVLETYCRASALVQKASYVEAAELFSEIPDTLDARVKAEESRDQAYLSAVRLSENGDYEAAYSAFTELGSFRDSESRRDDATALLIRTRLRAGAYHEALEKLSLLSDLSVFTELDPSESSAQAAFLDSFINVWMNAHAGVMNSFFSCNLLQPYLEPGGELDTLLRSELTDETAPANFGFIYLGSDITKLLLLDEGFSAAKVRGSASCSGPDGPHDLKETLWVLMDSSRGYPIAAAVFSA